MARFVDLDESDEDSSYNPAQQYTLRVLAAARSSKQPVQSDEDQSVWKGSQPASKASLAAAVACYPYAYMHATRANRVARPEWIANRLYIVSPSPCPPISILMTCIRFLSPLAAFTRAYRNFPAS